MSATSWGLGGMAEVPPGDSHLCCETTRTAVFTHRLLGSTRTTGMHMGSCEHLEHLHVCACVSVCVSVCVCVLKYPYHEIHPLNHFKVHSSWR